MTVAVLIALGLILVSLPAILAGWVRTLPPPQWARWCVVSLGAGSASIELGLVILGGPTLLRALGAHGLAAACARMAGGLVRTSPAAGWVAAVAAVTLPSLASAAVWRGRVAQRRFAAAAVASPRARLGGATVRVLPTSEPVALSVRARGRRHVAVSEGLRQLLDPDELDAVVRHEAAHVRHRHDAVLLVCSGIEVGLAVHPLVRRSTAVLRCALERWADEESAGTDPNARRAARDALVATAFAPTDRSLAAFGPAATVVERVEGLERPAPRRQWLRLAMVGLPTLMMSVAGLVVIGMFSVQLWSVLTMPVTCPVRVA